MQAKYSLPSGQNHVSISTTFLINPMSKILLMSDCVPPIVRGPSIILYRLFKHLRANSYSVLTSQYDGKGLILNKNLKLSCKYYYAKVETTVGGYKRTYFSTLIKWIEAFKIALEGVKVVKSEGHDKILVCPTHGNYLLAAYFVHKICKKNLYIYFFDLFRANKKWFDFDGLMRDLTVKLAAKSADGAFVMSEKLKDYYHARYPNLKIHIIRHPIDMKDYVSHTENSSRNGGNSSVPKKIVFTGMIYEYQIDAIQNLVKALEGFKNIEFHIYTERSKQYLESMGVTGENIIYCGYADNRDLIRIQKEADILFLPMSFHGRGTNPDIIRTASPVKISDYLAAGRPILVHAPEDSYIAWYAKKYEFGLVVDEPNANSLRGAIMRLMRDSQLKETLIFNAAKTGEMHNISRVLHEFISGLGIAH